MARKITITVTALALVLCALCAPISAATHNVYTEGNISTTYVQYFKDILSGANINDDYVGFRSGQYTYILVVGSLSYENGTISLDDEGTIYTFTQTGNYNSAYNYRVDNISTFSINCGDNIIYSNLGNYPHLIERSTHIETLILVTLGAMCVFVLADRIFRHS